MERCLSTDGAGGRGDARGGWEEWRRRRGEGGGREDADVGLPRGHGADDLSVSAVHRAMKDVLTRVLNSPYQIWNNVCRVKVRGTRRGEGGGSGDGGDGGGGVGVCVGGGEGGGSEGVGRGAWRKVDGDICLPPGHRAEDQVSKQVQ